MSESNEVGSKAAFPALSTVLKKCFETIRYYYYNYTVRKGMSKKDYFLLKKGTVSISPVTSS